MYQMTVAADTEGKTIPQGIQDLLKLFEDVFKEAEGLPPRREFDHRVPLLPGSKPVALRPYRHSPELKDEIEK